MTIDYTFDGKRLVPIPSPIPREADIDGWLTENGYGPKRHAERLGSEYGIGLEILGPADGTPEYEYVVFFGNGCYWVPIWLKSPLELMCYLNWAAPMITAGQLADIQRHLQWAYEWVFDESKGMLRDHVRHYRAKERAELRELEEWAKAKEAKR